MKNISNQKFSSLTACSIVILLSACGGSGTPGPEEENQPALGAATTGSISITNTTDLDVPVMFDWSSDKQVTLALVLHDTNGNLAAKTRVSVYEMPQSAAADANRQPTDTELQQVAEIFTGYSDSEGRVSATVSVSAHALATKNIYVKTKLMGVSSTAVVPIDETLEAGPQAEWIFGPPGIATEIDNGIDPSDLSRDYSVGIQSRSAIKADYFLEPFNQHYHSFYGHLPRAQWGVVCNVETDAAGTQCRSQLEQSELAQLSNIIQEGSAPPDKYLNANQRQSSLVFDKAAKVTVSFLQESAGFRNSLGFFKYNSFSEPTDPATLDSATILFPNTSFRGSGGFMQSGDSVSLGKIDPSSGEDAIGFYLAANGWDHDQGRGLEGEHFYSLSALNPEEDKTDAKHMLLIAKEEVNTTTNTRRLWLAFEDIRLDSGSSDRDYNDLVIQLDIYPADALVNADLIPDLSDKDNTTADADNDGVLAVDDIDDNDAERAFARYYPAEKSWATLMAEDNWPVLGDFDMNDMVIRYKVKEVIDGKGRVKDVSINYILEARGAAFHNGFAVGFGEGVFADNVESAVLNSEKVSPMNDSTTLAYQIFNDAWEYADRGENGCWQFNTVSSCKNQDASEFTLELSFNNAVEQTYLAVPPYNPFLTAHKVKEGTTGYTRFHSNNTALYTENGRVKDFEIHMPNQLPTQGQDVSMFGTGDDASNGVDRFYVSKTNLPWMLNIPHQIQYSEEYIDISMAYPGFSKWVASGGAEARDWYLEPADKFLIYDASAATEDSEQETNVDSVGQQSQNLSLLAKTYGRSLQSGSSFANVNDGKLDTVWTPAYNGGRVSLEWEGEGETINQVVIREAVGFEGAVRDWRLVDNQTGYELARGTGLNSLAPGVALIEFEKRTVQYLNFVIDNTNSNARFAISEFESYLE